MLPLILLSGQAGSGKDTLAQFLVSHHRAASLALADPMKRFALAIFGFSEKTLWGPSDKRNEVHSKFAEEMFAQEILAKVREFGPLWIEEFLGKPSRNEASMAIGAMNAWASGLLRQATEEGGLSARKMLQTFGTEWGRDVNKNVWIDYGKRTALNLLSGGYHYNRTYGLLHEDKSAEGPAMVVITDGRFRNEMVAVKAIGGQVWRVVSTTDSLSVEAAGIKGHRSEAEQRSIPSHFYDARIINDKSLGLGKAKQMVDAVVEGKIYEGVQANLTYFYPTYTNPADKFMSPAQPLSVNTWQFIRKFGY